MTRHVLTLSPIFLVALTSLANAAQRFPRPELPDTYVYPAQETPPAQSVAWEVGAVVLLAVALAAATWLVFKRRSRAGIFVLMLLALLYFGFIRRGCVCPVGSVHHVTASLFDGGFALPFIVVLFFALPLVAALLFGRVFCSAVCPLGAIQDVVLLKPAKVPRWLEHVLGFLAYAYLGLAVLFTVTGAGFIICRYDPFIAIFRLSGPLQMFILGGAILLLATLIGRPYCRFLCPYGVLLRLCSKISWKRVTITPDECITCRLCEEACPFGAIEPPTQPAEHRSSGKSWLAGALLALPLLIGLGAWLGHSVSHVLAGAHPTVLRARDVRADESSQTGELALRTQAFRKTGRTLEQLQADEDAVLSDFAVGSALFGAWLGLVAGAKLIGLSVRRTRTDYEANRGQCLACGRCFRYCPREHLRLKELQASTANDEKGNG